MSRRFWSLLALFACASVLSPCLATAFVSRQPADLAVSLTPPAQPVYVGQWISFTLAFADLGPASSRIPRLAPDVHGGLTSMRLMSCAGCPPAGAVFAAGQSLAQTWRGRVKNTDPITVAAAVGTVFRRAPDPNPGNDTASFSITPLVGRCTSPVPTTPGADRIFGTIGGDVVDGLGGDDLIRTGDGDDCVNGGSGDDTIAGGAGNDLLKGGPGADTISGGPGKDVISGGPGADRINAADGERDTINCGPGADALKADRFDRFRGCEHVRIV